MTKHSGRGGMGSHAHYASGHGGKNPRFKQNAVREANAGQEAEAEQKKRRRAVDLAPSVAEAMKASKPRFSTPVRPSAK